MDLRRESHGSIVLLRPRTSAGRAFVREVLAENPEAQAFGGALAVEPRYVANLIEIARIEHGLEVA